MKSENIIDKVAVNLRIFNRNSKDAYGFSMFKGDHSINLIVYKGALPSKDLPNTLLLADAAVMISEHLPIGIYDYYIDGEWRLHIAHLKRSSGGYQ